MFAVATCLVIFLIVFVRTMGSLLESFHVGEGSPGSSPNLIALSMGFARRKKNKLGHWGILHDLLNKAY